MFLKTHGAQPWGNRISGLTKRTLDVFFPDGIATEVACELESHVQCTTDMLSFKGYVHRWLAQTTQMAPFIYPTIAPVLRSSAAGMARACQADGTCGFRWNRNGYDGNPGAGQQMNALGALLALLLFEDQQFVKGPLTNQTGGTSVGNPDAGGDTSATPGSEVVPITGADRAGAGILTRSC